MFTSEGESRYYPPCTARVRMPSELLELSRHKWGWNRSEVTLMQRVAGQLDQVGTLTRTGVVGGDLVAVTDPKLKFVAKFPYEGNVLPGRVMSGYLLAKDNLGGILAPCIGCTALVEDEEGLETCSDVIFQKKIGIASDLIQELASQGKKDEILNLKLNFIRTNYRMWVRGILDRDADWEGNYGVDELGQFLLSDIGDLSSEPGDYPMQEGRPRSACLEPFIWGALNDVLFRSIFGRYQTVSRYASFIEDQRLRADDLPITTLVGSLVADQFQD
jgi:hypothetical protein